MGEDSSSTGAAEDDDVITEHMRDITQNLARVKSVLFTALSFVPSRARKAPRSSAGSSAAEAQLGERLNELQQTEDNYVSDLRLLVDSFMVPLRSRLPPDTLVAIFSNAKELLELHGGLYDAICCGAGEHELDAVATVASAFKERTAFFRLYAVYSANYVYAAQKLSAERRTDPQLDGGLAAQEGRVGVALQRLLIRPVQRVCQYPMLFDAILKALDPAAPETASFIAMSEALRATIEDVNEKVRAQENTLRMRGILTAELHGSGLKDLISPSRALVHEAQVRLRIEGSLRPEWRAKRDYKLYVFSDLVLIARRHVASRTGSYHLKARLPLNTLRCERAGGREKPSFTLVVTGGSAYIGTAGSHDEADALVSKVQQAAAQQLDASSKANARATRATSAGDSGR
jgi:hypothetical protein